MPPRAPPRDKRGRPPSPSDGDDTPGSSHEDKRRRMLEGGDGGAARAPPPAGDCLPTATAANHRHQAASNDGGDDDDDGTAGAPAVFSDDDDSDGGNAAAAAAARARAVAAAASTGLDGGGASVPPSDAVMGEAGGDDDDDVDPLDAFMAANDAAAAAEMAAATAAAAASATAAHAHAPPPAPRRRRRAASSSSSGEADTDDDAAATAGAAPEQTDAEWAAAVALGRTAKGDKLAAVDHTTIDYPPFRRKFYVEAPALARLTPAQVAAARADLDGLTVRGAAPLPAPLQTWNQAGLPSRVLNALTRAGLTTPLPVQAQALPVIMSGRDCLAIAKTGSGKTLAYVLPSLRHVRDQPPLAPGDGPIALILAPTRELVHQIGKDARRLARAVGLTVVSAYGGSALGTQISDLKRGAEIVAATPGRLIDVLSTSGGRVTNARRVTYFVLDEADRMFDMGFEPQVARVAALVRPDRQTVMFSATFPRSVEALARALLTVAPVEITVGGRSVVNSDITQIVEVRPPEDRFLRLLELLGEWYERGKILVFVSSQDGCDSLFRDLLRVGYPCLSLHGGKDQADRASTIADFKGDVASLLVATSVAARGLDVRGLVLVVNYDPPNHVEDYVHRVGRTGRAGAKGTAVTFVGPEDGGAAVDVARALRDARAPVPADLAALADAHRAAVKAGTARGGRGGFGGSGFKFDEAEAAAARAGRAALARDARRAAGLEDEFEEVGGGGSDDDEGRPGGGGASDGDDGVMEVGAARREAAATADAAAAAAPPTPTAAPADAEPEQSTSAPVSVADAMAAAAARVAAMKQGDGGGGGGGAPAAAAPAAAPTATAARKPPALAAALAAAKAAAARVAGAAAVARVTTPVERKAAAPPPSPPVAPAPPPPPPPPASTAGPAQGAVLAAARAAAAAVSARMTAASAAAVAAAGAAPAPAARRHFQAELEINDFPQAARWKATHKTTVDTVQDSTGAAIISKGVFVERGAAPPPGERKMYLLIQAQSADAVRAAKAQLKAVIEESTEKALRRETGAAGPSVGKYTVL